MPCPNENDNKPFKTGKLSIIVTTNMKKDFLNNQKLSDLLPEETEYMCNSIDRVLNLPGNPKLSEKDQFNLNRTGNLPTSLKVKVGAPVVLTSNHPKAIYRDDGIMNGARGYIQAIQTSQNNPFTTIVPHIVTRFLAL